MLYYCYINIKSYAAMQKIQYKEHNVQNLNIQGLNFYN